MATNNKYKARQAKLSVTVSADIGEFTAGDVLTTELDIAEYFRTQMKEGNAGEFDMDDAEIMGVVRAVPYVKTEGEEEGSSDWEIAVCLAIEQRMAGNAAPVEVVTGRTLPDTRTAVEVDLSPAKYGEWLDSIPEWREAMHKAAMAPIDNALAPLHVLNAQLAAHGVTIKNNGDPTTWVSSMDNRPIPGSEPSVKYLKENNNAVKFADQYLFARYKKIPRGSTTAVPYDYWKTVVDCTAEGKAFIAELELISKAQAKGKGQAPDGPYAKYSITLLEGMKRKAEMGYNGMSRGIQNAIACWYVMRDIQQHEVLSKNIGVRFQVATPGREPVVINSVQPIVIYDKSVPDGGPRKSYTVTSFRNLDLAIAIERGGTYKDLIESTKAGPNDTETATVEPLKLDDIPNVLSELNVFLGLKLNVAEQGKACRAKAGPGEVAELGRSVEANDLLMNWRDLYLAAGRVLATVPAYAKHCQEVEEYRAAQETIAATLAAKGQAA